MRQHSVPAPRQDKKVNIRTKTDDVHLRKEGGKKVMDCLVFSPGEEFEEYSSLLSHYMDEFILTH